MKPLFILFLQAVPSVTAINTMFITGSKKEEQLIIKYVLLRNLPSSWAASPSDVLSTKDKRISKDKSSSLFFVL